MVYCVQTQLDLWDTFFEFCKISVLVKYNQG
jgi:hypothetical protein